MRKWGGCWIWQGGGWVVIAAQAPPFSVALIAPPAGNYREGLGSSIRATLNHINHCALAAYPPQNPPFTNSAPGTLRWAHRPPSPPPSPQQTSSTRGSTAMRTPLARARRGGRAKATNQRPVPNCHQPPYVAVLTGPRPSRLVGARGSRSLSVHNTCTWKLGY